MLPRKLTEEPRVSSAVVVELAPVLDGVDAEVEEVVNRRCGVCVCGDFYASSMSSGDYSLELLFVKSADILSCRQRYVCCP